MINYFKVFVLLHAAKVVAGGFSPDQILSEAHYENAYLMYMGYDLNNQAITTQHNESIKEKVHRVLSTSSPTLQSTVFRGKNESNKKRVTVEIMTDRNPDEITWEVIPVSSSVPVMSGGSYSV